MEKVKSDEQLFDSLTSEEIEALRDAPLKRLLRMSKMSNEFNRLCQIEYRKRFRRIVGVFFDNVDALSDLMLRTNTYVSGSMTMPFITPGYFSGEAMDNHDLDLYIDPSALREIVIYLLHEEKFSLVCQYDMRPVGIPYEFGARSGIEKVVKFEKGGKKVDVVVSAGKHPLYPVLHFHFTAPMNALSPNEFISFYSTMTLNGKAMYNDTAFEICDPVFDLDGHRKMKEKAKIAAAKYECRGFIIKDSADFEGTDHPKNCLNSRCRQTRYSDDPATLRISFGLPVDPFHAVQPVIRWRLGGFNCGDFESQYEPFFVNVLM